MLQLWHGMHPVYTLFHRVCSQWQPTIRLYCSHGWMMFSKTKISSRIRRGPRQWAQRILYSKRSVKQVYFHEFVFGFWEHRCPFPLVKTKCLLGCRSERRSPPMMLTSVLLKNTRGPFSWTKRKSSALYDPNSLWPPPPPFRSCWNCNWLNGINNCLVLITRLCFVPHNIYVHCILLSV